MCVALNNPHTGRNAVFSRKFPLSPAGKTVMIEPQIQGG